VTDLARRIEAIPLVVSTTERGIFFPNPDLHQRVHNLETAAIERWNGSQWVTDFTGGGMVTSGPVPASHEWVSDPAWNIGTIPGPWNGYAVLRGGYHPFFSSDLPMPVWARALTTVFGSGRRRRPPR